jgi:hypothetical protein
MRDVRYFSMAEMTHIRMDEKLKKRIREYIKVCEDKTHIKLTFSQAMRSLLEQALDRNGMK